MADERDVLINFVGKTDELQPAEDVLSGIIEKEGEIGQAWKKTSEVINTETKKNTDNTSKLAKSIDAMALAAKSMDKVVIGGAYKQYLTQIQSQLGLTNKELIAYVQNARKAAQEAIFSAQTPKEAADLKVSIEVMNEQLIELQKNSGDTGDKMNFLRTRLQEAKEQFAKLAAAGIQTGPAFDAAKAKLQDLSEQMRIVNEATKNLGSQHKNIDGLISLAGGVAGGFAVAQGAAALFGDQSEDVQRALLKVNAAMSILQGLQAVQNVLQKESAASLFLNNLFRKDAVVTTAAQTVATEGLVVAEGAQVVATEAATVAQVELNTAMALNPVGLVIIGVLALIAAINMFSDSSDGAAKMQDEMNRALKEDMDLLNDDLHIMQRHTDLNIALAKQRGASSLELAKMEGNAGNERIAKINLEREALAKKYNENADVIYKLFSIGVEVDKDVLDAHEKMLARIDEMDKQSADERNALLIKQAEYRKSMNDAEQKSFIAFEEAKVSATIAGSDAERTAQINAILATSKAKKEMNPDLTPGEIAKIDADEERQIRGLNLQNYQHYLKGRTALYDSYIADAKLQIIKGETDSLESINKVTDAEIAALKKRRDEALKSDPNLNKGERLKIIAESNLAIAELEKTKQARIYEIQKSAINAQLIQAQKGTQQELDLKISMSLEQEAIELLAKELTEQKRLEILAKYDQIRKDAIRAFNEQHIQNEIFYLNAYLDEFGITEQRKLELTINRLDHQRDLEISQAEGNAAKIKEINAKYDKQILDAKRAMIKAVLDDQIKSFTTFTAIQDAAAQRTIAKDTETLQKKIMASELLLNHELYNLYLEKTALDKQLAAKTISQHDYDLAVQDLSNKRTAAEIANQERITAATNREIEKRVAKLQAVFALFQKGLQETMGTNGFTVLITQLQDFALVVDSTMQKLKEKTITTTEAIKAIAAAAIAATQTVVNQIFADASASRQQILADEIAALEEQKQRELNVQNLTEQQKADVANRFRNEERRLKIQAFNADKEAKKSQALINGALAVTLAFASYVWPYNLIVAGIMAALTGIEISEINRQQPPRFRHGKVDIQGLGTETSDSIPSLISKGESVINAPATKKWKGALEAMNADSFENYIMHQFKDFIFPQVPDHVQAGPHGLEIDYNMLARAVAAEMKGIIPAPAQITNVIDGDGFHTFIQDGNSRVESLNKRYSMTSDS